MCCSTLEVTEADKEAIEKAKLAALNRDQPKETKKEEPKK